MAAAATKRGEAIALLAAAEPTLARLLLARGVSPNVPTGERGPLYRAARRGHREVARLLLEAGADPNASDRWGRQPLHAAIAGDRGIVELLLNLPTGVRSGVARVDSPEDLGTLIFQPIGFSHTLFAKSP